MNRILIIPILFFLFPGFIFNISAQDQCGTGWLHQQLMQTDSAYKSGFLSKQDEIHAILKNRSLQKMTIQTYTIPVVVHVIHLGEPVGTGTNISDAQILEAINGLNDRFGNNIGNGSIDIEINFCLAIRDPNGCPTNGINRVNGSAISNYSSLGISFLGCSIGANEDSVKTLSRWPVSNYYNIWVVNNICNGQWGGYANYPYGGVNDGTVIRSLYIRNSSYLLSHEVGHGLFLFHTFEGDGNNTSCPINADCFLNGDRCCDTPPHKQNDCGVSNPCTASGIWENSRYNYMSYCVGSLGRFTSDQKNRMQATMLVAPRLNLVNSLGCTPFVATVTPGGPTTFCQGDSVTLTSNTANSYNWSNGATTQSISVLSSGNYFVTITNANGCSVISSVTTVTVNPTPSTPTITQNGNQLASSAASGNHWYLNNVIIAGAIQQTYTPVTSGNYTVQVTINNCTSIFSSVFSFIVTGLPNINVVSGQIKVFPNPVKDKLIITKSSNNLSVLNLRLVDMNGKQLTKISSSASRIEIDMTKYAGGTYIVWIEDKMNKILGKKVIVKL